DATTSDDPSLFQGRLTWFAVSCALVVAGVAAHPSGLVARFLELGPLRRLGLLSYGVYLWHWPVFLVVDNEHTSLAGAPLLVVRLVVTVALAAISYDFVEQPIRYAPP